MKLIGRDLQIEVLLRMLAEHPISCALQSVQKIRQLSGLDYKFLKSGWSFPPIIITFEITHRCNLRCRTCWFWGKHGKYAKGGEFKELSLEEIKKFIDSISSFKPYFLLTGGEPLLYPCIEEVVEYASKKGMFVGLITNGMLATEEKLSKVIDAGLNFITVSIDSPNKETHNFIRGNKDSFNKCIETLKILKRLKQNRFFPIVTINSTISRENYSNLEGMLKIAKDCGVNIMQFQHQWFTDSSSSKAYSKWAEKNLGLKSDHIGTFETGIALGIDGEKLYKQLERIRNNEDVFVRVFPDLTQEETIEYYKSMKCVYNKRCISPWFGIIVKPNGDVVPCIDYKIGNIKDAEFSKIWNSERMRLFRRKIIEQKYFPGCTRCCGFFQR